MPVRKAARAITDSYSISGQGARCVRSSGRRGKRGEKTKQNKTRQYKMALNKRKSGPSRNQTKPATAVSTFKDKTGKHRRSRQIVSRPPPSDVDDDGGDICPVCDSDCKCARGNDPASHGIKIVKNVKKRRSAKYTSKLAPQQVQSDSDEDSLSDSSFTSDSDSGLKVLKLEEKFMQNDGLDSDEEDNHHQIDEISDSGSTSSDSSISNSVNSSGSSVLEDPNELEQIWSTEDEAAVAHQTLEYLASNLDDDPDMKAETIKLPPRAKRSRNDCKKLRQPMEPDIPKQLSSISYHQKKPVFVSPQVIQAYMAARGTPVDTEKAKYFSDLMTSGPFVHAVNFASSHGSYNNAEKYCQNDVFDDKLTSPQNVQPYQVKTVTLEDLLLLDQLENDDDEVKGKDKQNLSSLPVMPMRPPSDSVKWNRIPIGSFRRSRRNSKPLLKLSTAVKNNFGVVPVSIHETLLGSGVVENMKKSQKHSINMSPSTSLSVGPPSHELGIGSTVEKKLSSKKARIMENVKKREKKMKEILRLIDSTVSEESTLNTDLNCSCSDCDDDKVLQIQERKKIKRRSRKNSLPLDDLTHMIHDPAHPPSACTSPDKLFIISPHIIGENPQNTHSGIDHLTLEPSIMSTRDPGSNDIIADLPMVSFTPSFSRSAPPKRRRRKSSIFSAGASRIPNIEQMLKFLK